jgi:hypothetical protein
MWNNNDCACGEERRHVFHALKKKEKKKDLVALGTHPHPNKYIHLFSFIINITQYVAFFPLTPFFHSNPSVFFK